MTFGSWYQYHYTAHNQDTWKIHLTPKHSKTTWTNPWRESLGCYHKMKGRWKWLGGNLPKGQTSGDPQSFQFHSANDKSEKKWWQELERKIIQHLFTWEDRDKWEERVQISCTLRQIKWNKTPSVSAILQKNYPQRTYPYSIHRLNDER